MSSLLVPVALVLLFWAHHATGYPAQHCKPGSHRVAPLVFTGPVEEKEEEEEEEGRKEAISYGGCRDGRRVGSRCAW